MIHFRVSLQREREGNREKEKKDSGRDIKILTGERKKRAWILSRVEKGKGNEVRMNGDRILGVVYTPLLHSTSTL